MRILQLLLVVVIGSLVLVAACGEKKQSRLSDEAKIAARVNDWTLTRSDLDKLINMLPETQRKKYLSPEGRAEFARMIMEEELYYQDGLKKGIDEDEGVQQKIKDARRRIIINEYFQRYVRERARPSDEEMHDYYEEHKDRFMTQAVLKAQHIFSKDRSKLVELKKRIENGEKMTTLAHQYSEDDITRGDGGDLGYFNPGGYVRFIGYSKEWSDAVSKLEPGVVSDPIKFEKGYSLVRVNKKTPAKLKPYEEVKNRIEEIIVKQRIEQVREEFRERLVEENHAVNYLEEEIKKIQRSPEELWEFAQTSTDSYQRLNAYKEIVDKYPDSKYAPQALFMVGFVYSEELKDQLSADRAFNRVIKDFPDTDIARSARWMLENMGKPMPEFEDLDDLNKKIQEQEQQGK